MIDIGISRFEAWIVWLEYRFVRFKQGCVLETYATFRMQMMRDKEVPVITMVPSSLLTSKFCPTPTGIAGDDTIYRTIIPNKVLIVWDKEPQIVWTEGWVVTKGLGWVNIIQTKKQFENSSLYQTHTHGIEDQEARLVGSILGTFIPLAER